MSGLRFGCGVVGTWRDSPRSSTPGFLTGSTGGRVYESSTFLLLAAVRVAASDCHGHPTRAAVASTMINPHHEYRDAFLMGDLVLRVSLLAQRGYLCASCGNQIDGQLHSEQRRCRTCEALGSVVARKQAKQGTLERAGGDDSRA